MLMSKIRPGARARPHCAPECRPGTRQPTCRPVHAVRKSVLLPYSARQMFELVDRVEDYPSFLPWCGGTEVARNEIWVLYERDRSVALPG